MEIRDLLKIIEVLDEKISVDDTEIVNHGYCIVVLDRGYIYLGDFVEKNGRGTIKRALSIRRWTSGKGLIWHAENGSQDVVLDGNKTQDINFLMDKYEHSMPTKEELWTT